MAAIELSGFLKPQPWRVLAQPHGSNVPSKYTPSIPNRSIILSIPSARKSCQTLW